jgi:hypothetical protein
MHDYLNRRFRASKKIDPPIRIFFWFYESVPHAITPRHFFTVKLKNLDVFPFEFYQNRKRPTLDQIFDLLPYITPWRSLYPPIDLVELFQMTPFSSKSG